MAAAITVRRARGDELHQVWHLSHDEYVRSGLIQPQLDRHYPLYPDLDGIPETTVLVAVEGGMMTGSMTMTMDGERGLPTDADYPAETQAERDKGRPLASCWRLATAFDCRSRHGVLAALMRHMTHLLVGLGEPTLLMECHPRHVLYYRRRFGFEAVGERKTTHGLTDAPSVLMVGGPGSYSRLLPQKG